MLLQPASLGQLTVRPFLSTLSLVVIHAVIGIIYLVLGLSTLGTGLKAPAPLGNTLRLATVVSIVGGLALATMAVLDHHFYGSWTFPPLNFLHFNLLTASF